MAFVVEDGTVVPDANAYITAVFANTYFADRGIDAWGALSTDNKQQAIVQATSYIDARWFNVFRGTLVSETQPLSFPRRYLTADSVMPIPLLKATAEYALRASIAPLAPDITYDETNRLYTKKVEEVGPIKEEYSFTGSDSQPSRWRAYPAADIFIASLLRLASNSLVRA